MRAVRCGLAGPDKLTTAEVQRELRLGRRQLHARRRALALTWKVEPWGGGRRAALYDAGPVGRAAARLAAERAGRPWDETRIIRARQTAAQRRELAALGWELLRRQLRLELSRTSCDLPLRELPRERLAAARAVVEGALRRQP